MKSQQDMRANYRKLGLLPTTRMIDYISHMPAAMWHSMFLTDMQPNDLLQSESMHKESSLSQHTQSESYSRNVFMYAGQ